MPTTLFQDVKRPGQSLVAIGVTGLQPSRLYHVIDKPTGIHLLVDTRAEVSVVPPSRTHKQVDFSLQAVNNTSIATYGTRSLTLDLGLRRTFQWVFIIADVQQPILGADFLRHYNLLMDMKHNRLSDTLTQLKVQGIVSQGPSPSPTLLPTNEFTALLSEFRTISQPGYKEQSVQHDVTHHIDTKGPPVSSHTCRLAPEWLKIAF